MRGFCLILTLLAGPASAQQIQSVDPPAGVEALMATTIEDGDQMLGLAAYPLDADRDGDTDLIVEVASNPIGGNAVFVLPYILRNAGGRYEIAGPLDISGSITALRQDGDVLTVTTQTYLDGDPRCCPSGVEIKSFALR